MATPRGKKLDERELVAMLRQMIEDSEGFDSDQLSDNREQALNYYYGRDNVHNMAGRSQVRSLDVADMIEAVMAQIMPAFEIDDVAMFEATSDDDVEQAQIESNAVNEVIMEANRGYVMFSECIRDALLLRNGWAKVWVDERDEVQTQRFENLDPIVVLEMLDSESESLAIDVLDEEQGDEGLINITLRITRTTRTLKVDSVDPTLILFSENYDSLFLEDIPFLAELDYPTRSELVQQGFDKKKVYDQQSITADADRKNDQRARNRGNSQDAEAPDPANETLMRYTIYALVDFDGDGIAERRRIELINRTIFSNEPDDFIPYATGTPFLQPHRLNGLSLFDKLKEIQNIKTATLRSYVDNMSSNNNARMAYRRGAVDLDMATTSRPGGLIECMDPQTDLVPIPIQDTGNSNLQLLEYADKMRSERGGASLDLQGAQMQIAGDTAHGVERQISTKEQLAAMICRTLSETLVRSIYQKTHEAMRLFMPGQMTLGAANEFVQTDPSQWQSRERINIKTGLSTSERMRKVQTLSLIISEHKQLAEMGQAGILFTLDQSFAAYMDMARASGLDAPERYFLDPSSEEAQATQQANQQQQQQSAAEQKQAQEQLLQVQQEIEAQHDATRVFTARLDAMVKILGISADMEQAEAKLVGEATLKLTEQALRGPDGSESESATAA